MENNMQILAITPNKINIPKQNYSLTLSGVSPAFTAVNADTITKKTFSNKKTQKIYEKFEKKYSLLSQKNIYNAFKACISSYGGLDKYALATLNALYQGELPELFENIKLKINKTLTYSMKQQDYNDGNSLIKE